MVEDDGQLRRVLGMTLLRHGIQTVPAATGAEATAQLLSQNFDIVVLDLGLPDIDGVDLITWLRTRDDVPLIVLSARRDEADKVKALAAGADDYLAKPFGINELLARIRAATRRVSPDTQELRVEIDGLTIDTRTRKVSLDEQDVRLTPIEWRIIEVLLTSRGRVVTNGELAEAVWHDNAKDHTGSLRVHISGIRQKIERLPSEPKFIISSPGIGYSFKQ